MVRKLLVGALVVAALAVGPGSALAHPPDHWHCFTSASGKTHLIARGVTEHAPHIALEQFHFKVHRAVFGVTGTGRFDVEGKHPLGPVLFSFSPSCP